MLDSSPRTSTLPRITINKRNFDDPWDPFPKTDDVLMLLYESLCSERQTNGLCLFSPIYKRNKKKRTYIKGGLEGMAWNGIEWDMG